MKEFDINIMRDINEAFDIDSIIGIATFEDCRPYLEGMGHSGIMITFKREESLYYEYGIDRCIYISFKGDGTCTIDGTMGSCMETYIHNIHQYDSVQANRDAITNLLKDKFDFTWFLNRKQHLDFYNFDNLPIIFLKNDNFRKGEFTMKAIKEFDMSIMRDINEVFNVDNLIGKNVTFGISDSIFKAVNHLEVFIRFYSHDLNYSVIVSFKGDGICAINEYGTDGMRTVSDVYDTHWHNSVQDNREAMAELLKEKFNLTVHP